MDVVVGTHPIPQNYFDRHMKLGTWDSKMMENAIQLTLTHEAMRISYD